MDYSLLGPVHGISQAKILEWVAISFSRDQTCVSCIGRWIRNCQATKEAQIIYDWYRNFYTVNSELEPS